MSTQESTKKVFVGRQAEIDELKKILEDAFDRGHPRFVFLKGEFGIGKTELAKRFIEEAQKGDRQLIAAYSQCINEAGTGFLPFAEIYKQISHPIFKLHISPTKALEFTRKFAEAWIPIIFPPLMPLVAVSATAKAVQEAVFESAPNHPAAIKYSEDQIRNQYVNAIRELAQTRRLLIVIDDLQWASASSLRLLQSLSQSLGSAHVVFLCVHRNVDPKLGEEFAEARAKILGACDLTLAGIHVVDYVDSRYPSHKIASELLERVQTFSKGNALFLELLFDIWQADGTIFRKPARGGSCWCSIPSHSVKIPIPENIHTLFQKRLAPITDEIRHVLESAAVEGDPFEAETVREVVRISDFRVFDDLGILNRKFGIVTSLKTETFETNEMNPYVFTHPFFREDIYQSLEEGLRDKLHNLVVLAIEANFKDALPPEFLSRLARHSTGGHQWLKAAEYSLQAAEYHSRQSMWEVVQEMCELGLKALSKLKRSDYSRQLEMKLCVESGEGFFQAGNYAKADQRFQEALKLAQDLSLGSDAVAQLYERRASTAMAQSDYDLAKELADTGYDLLVSIGQKQGETALDLAVTLGTLETNFGRGAESISALLKALNDANALAPSDRVQRACVDAYNCLGVAYSYQDDYVNAVSAFKKGYHLAISIGAQAKAVTCLINLADTYGWLDTPELGDNPLDEAFKIADHIGDNDNMVAALETKGELLVRRGLPKAAAEILEEAISLSNRIGFTFSTPYAYAALAAAYLDMSQMDDAYETAIKGVSLADKDRHALGYNLTSLARIEYARGDWQSACDHIEQAITIHYEEGDRHLGARAQRQYAVMLMSKGETTKGLELIESSLETFKALKLVKEIAETEVRRREFEKGQITNHLLTEKIGQLE